MSLTKKIITGFATGFVSALLLRKIRTQIRSRSFKGAVVLVSGGSRGLGLLIAKEFCRAGASVALTARDGNELRRAQNILQLDSPQALVHTFVCDCRIPLDVEQTVAQVVHTFGKVDVLVNNAGIISSSPLEHVTEADYEDSLAVHFWGPYHFIEHCLPVMNKGSRIVNIASIGGLIPIPHRAAYCVGKHALVGYSRGLHSELAAKGIYVTTVSPNVMRTGSIDHATFKGQVQKEYAWFSILASMPLLSTSADTAAQRIFHACVRGDAELILSLPTKIAATMQARFPNMFSDLMYLANMVMPGPGQANAVEGRDAHSSVSPSFLTSASQRAAERNNEGPIH
ncbi:SDR family NAD(P)-dependent oxidoreductase [Bdellovibrio bacteriovorus]|uniref:Putative oxidoreductase n=1 Tax=Bdellovibrio bacteriovorus str. Tiberius TaxID=1069642 RepID=K7ZEK1_BDEBC|nr:SDR family oxidoreductase [Bdellovibrio bacteriovorus]AFY00557.1 putative oxidoreductase [Bdellovibrio bacteriovorus str. Tiberius]